MFDPERVTALTFDSYSTLVDVDAAVGALADYVEEPERVAALWRSHSLFYSVCANQIDAYEPFYDLNRHALTYALEVHGIDATEEVRDDILAVYMDLDVFDDVHQGMARLSEAYDCWVVSNGDPAMLEALIDLADIGDLVEGFVSADEVETFKPAPGLYEHAAERIGVSPGDLAHVSAGWFDVQGAKHAGMQGVWTNRKREPWVHFDGDPDLEVADFNELADELGV